MIFHVQEEMELEALTFRSFYSKTIDMRLLSLYVIKDQLYFIPNGKLPNGIYVLIEPIKQLATSAEVLL